ncbi:hypothetical protein T439DRAFT_378964 [Meredithblackwellia eburnea MCA 4105]
MSPAITDDPEPIDIPHPGNDQHPAGEEGPTHTTETLQVPAVGLAADGPHKRNRFKRHRKKKKGSGFEPGRTETAAHEADKLRYDPTLPFDLRLLRCVDEWRSLRSLPPDFKISFESLLFHLRADVTQLRIKFGRQALRGVEPERNPNLQQDDEEKKKKGADSDDDEAEEVIPFDLDSQDEEAWGARTFDRERIAKWLDDRSNDGYTPTLLVAPTILSNFLTFLLCRSVFPKLEKMIRDAIPVADHAKAQLSPSYAMFKLVKRDPLQKSLVTLFSNPETSKLLSPISATKSNQQDLSPISDETKSTAAPATIAEYLSAADFLHDVGDEELAGDTNKLEDDDLGWSQYKDEESTTATPEGEGEGEGVGKKKKVDDSLTPEERAKRDALRRAREIRQQLEEEAKKLEAWRVPRQSQAQAVEVVRREFERIGFDVEREGVWKAWAVERSARSVVGWEKVAMKIPPPLPKLAGENEGGVGVGEKEAGGGGDSDEEDTKESAERTANLTSEEELQLQQQQQDTGPQQYYRLHLSEHQSEFPLTSFFRVIDPDLDSDKKGSSSTMSTPTSIIVPEASVKYLVRGVVFEMDLVHLKFTTSQGAKGKEEGEDKLIRTLNSSERKELEEQRRQLSEVRILKSFWRVIPSYWKLLGEYVRDEPGRQTSFEGGWGPAEAEESASSPGGTGGGDDDLTKDGREGLWPRVRKFMTAQERQEAQDAGSMRSPQSFTGMGPRGGGRGRGRGRRGGRGGKRGGGGGAQFVVSGAGGENVAITTAPAPVAASGASGSE